MRDLRTLEVYRKREEERQIYGVEGDECVGVFFVPPANANGRALRVVATNSDGWDHVSVSLPDRTPTWDEMERIKRLFFKEDEAAMQLHVPSADHINCHPHCLHLWRPHAAAIPLPPKEFVA